MTKRIIEGTFNKLALERNPRMKFNHLTSANRRRREFLKSPGHRLA